MSADFSGFFPDYDKEHKVGVTGQQRMLITLRDNESTLKNNFKIMFKMSWRVHSSVTGITLITFFYRSSYILRFFIKMNYWNQHKNYDNWGNFLIECVYNTNISICNCKQNYTVIYSYFNLMKVILCFGREIICNFYRPWSLSTLIIHYKVKIMNWKLDRMWIYDFDRFGVLKPTAESILSRFFRILYHLKA